MHSKYKVFIPYFVLAAVCWLTHSAFRFGGTSMINSDYAFMALESPRLLQGDWSAFYLGQDYGGTVLGLLRAVWLMLLSSMSLTQGNILFSYLVCPVFMTWASFYLVRSYCGEFASWIVGTIAAVGFNFWVIQYGNDFYIAYLLLGFLVLGIRAPYLNPLMEMPLHKLLLSGLLCGLGVYTNRAFLIFLVAAFIPDITIFIKEWRHLRKKMTLADSILVGIAITFIGAFLYLEFFGATLGTWNGQSVVLHAHPNLHIAVGIMLTVYSRHEIKRINAKILQRSALLAAVLFLGFLPELFHFWSQGRSVPSGSGATQGYSGMMQTWALLPESIKTLFTAGDSLLSNLSLILILLALIHLIKIARTKAQVQPILLLLILGLFAYGRVKTYTVGPPRYLLPIFPAVLLSIGFLVDRYRAQKWAMLGIGILVSGHLVSQWNSQMNFLNSSKTDSEYHRQIVRNFENAGAKLVVTDNYWKTNQLSLGSAGKVWFYFPGGLLPKALLPILEEARQSDPVTLGYLQSKENPDQEIQLSWNGKSIPARLIERVGPYQLYLTTQR